MTFEEILKAKNDIEKAYQNECEIIKKLEKKIEWHEKKKRKMNTDTILIPLATEICKRKGFKHFEIYGPFGLTCETSIYFSNIPHTETDKMQTKIDICKVDTWGITLTPTNKCESEYEYWTGEQTNDYQQGSIGWLNGMNNVYKPLPNDIDEIIKLLRFSEGRAD